MRCQLCKEHGGPHREEFKRGEKPVIVTWEINEKEDEEKIEDYEGFEGNEEKIGKENGGN
jgi:hypothetical protein